MRARRGRAGWTWKYYTTKLSDTTEVIDVMPTGSIQYILAIYPLVTFMHSLCLLHSQATQARGHMSRHASGLRLAFRTSKALGILHPDLSPSSTP